MRSSGMLRHVALVRTYISEENIASTIRVTRIGELRLIVTANVAPSSPILVSTLHQCSVSSLFLMVKTLESLSLYACRLLVGDSEGKKPLGRPRRR
jgi:hypothetical protein